MSLIGILAIFATICLFFHNAYAVRYDLDEMSVIVPDALKIKVSTDDQDEKIFNIVNNNTKESFGNILYAHSDTDANFVDKSLDSIKLAYNNYQEIKRGCDDGLLSIKNNYCAVKFYTEDSSGNGLYTLQLFTQVRNGVSAIWTFGDATAAGLDNKISTILDIVDSMGPYSSSNTGMDNSDINQQQNVFDKSLNI